MIQMKRWRRTGAWAGPFAAEPDFAIRPSAPREIPLERNLVALLLAEDERSKPRELWLGMGLAAAMLVLVASGAGIPLLAAGFCLAPVIGIGLEILAAASGARRETRA